VTQALSENNMISTDCIHEAENAANDMAVEYDSQLPLGEMTANFICDESELGCQETRIDMPA